MNGVPGAWRLREGAVNGGDAEKRTGPGGPASDEALSARLRALGSQLDRQEAARKPERTSGPNAPSGVSPLGQAMRLSSEFIGGAVVGGAIGWGIDQLAGTKPWGLTVFLLLGFAAGIYNVMRTSGFIAKPVRKNGQDEA